MQLEEFYDYKNQLMGDILTNKDIVCDYDCYQNGKADGICRYRS